MTSLDPRRRERLIGAVVVLVGVGVLVLSVIALLDARSTGASATSTVTLPAAGSSTRPGGSTSASGSDPASRSGSASASHSASGSTSAGASTTSSRVGAAAAHMPLVVLNNSTRGGLAQQAAQTFAAGGWTVTSTGNLTDTIESTCAYFDPAVAGAQQAATTLQTQFPTIKRTKAKFAGLPAGPVVVVLTSDYTAP